MESHFLGEDSEGLDSRVETYHLEDLGSMVIEEKAEEEETTTNQVVTNKNVDDIEDINDEDDLDTKIMDEASVARRSINSSLINIKKTKAYGRKSDL